MFPPSSRCTLASRQFSSSVSVFAARPGAKPSKGGSSLSRNSEGKKWDKTKTDNTPEPFVPFPGKLFSPLDDAILKRLQTEKPTPASYPEFKPGLQQSSAGKVVQLGSNEANSLINSFGLPRTMLLDFRFSPKPTFVVRDTTISLAERLKSAQSSPSADTRLVLHGREGSGKSYLLLQAAQLCHLDKWIVLYFPRATKLLDACTSYSYDPRTHIYMQHEFARETLRRLVQAQKSKLQEIRLDEATATAYAHLQLSPGTPLSQVASIPQNDLAPAMDYLLAVVDALSAQKSFPVLIAVDEFQALYRRSEYRDPHFAKINSFHLSMPRMLLEYANGTRSFNRGAFIGALSVDLRNPVPLELIESLELTPAQPTTSYSPRRLAYASYAEGLTPVAVPPLSFTEAASVFEMWSGGMILHTPKADEVFLSKYTESGGNARDFVWRGCLGTLEA